MIYFLSDLHGTTVAEGLAEYKKIGTMNDLLILLGDTELNLPDHEDYQSFTDTILHFGLPIALIDGNHENYPWMNGFPIEEWNGGLVNRLSETAVHLRRGEIYTIEGKTFFAMGGWLSSDKWHERGLWFPEEAPSTEELDYGKENLKRHGNQVDFILTHQYNIDLRDPQKEKELREYCVWLNQNVTFTKWYFGHCHWDREIDEKHRVVYFRLVRVGE